MPRGRKHKIDAATRAQIAEACRKRDEGDKTQPSVEELAQQQGVSARTIYRYAAGSSQARPLA